MNRIQHPGQRMQQGQYKGGPLPNPQEKLINVNRRLGNGEIAKQQGTTRVIYDSLPMDGTTNMRFFENANNRSFPFTNLGSFGNQLNVGESLVVQRAYLTVFTVDDSSTPPEITDLTDFDGVGEVGLYKSELQLSVANQTVVKPIPLTSFFHRWNKYAWQDEASVFFFDTELIIPPLYEFVWDLRLPSYTPIADTFIGLHIEGVGAILNTRGTL